MMKLNEFDKVDMRVGTIIEASVNKKARNKAYKLKIDLGSELGVKKSSAQITDLYTCENLIGKQVIVVTNFEPMHIGDVKSEVRVLGAETNDGVVLLRLDKTVINGSKIF